MSELEMDQQTTPKNQRLDVIFLPKLPRGHSMNRYYIVLEFDRLGTCSDVERRHSWELYSSVYVSSLSTRCTAESSQTTRIVIVC